MILAATPVAPLRPRPAPALPVARLVVGKPAEEVAALVPRLFSLCRAAQAAAVDTALGRPADVAGIGQEILRDHLLKLCVSWPKLLGMDPRPIPFATLSDTEQAKAIFGPAARAPATPAEFTAFMNSTHGAAPVLSRIAQCFAPGEAATAALPAVTPTTIWAAAAIENSTAARHVDHPVMRMIETRHGRGPLWRAAARLYDIESLRADRLPPIETPRPGTAMVPATRGTYAVRIETDGPIVTRLDRMTPTDSLMAKGGILDQSLASLPATKTALAPLMLDILDPCSPVTLETPDA